MAGLVLEEIRSARAPGNVCVRPTGWPQAAATGSGLRCAHLRDLSARHRQEVRPVVAEAVEPWLSSYIEQLVRGGRGHPFGTDVFFLVELQGESLSLPKGPGPVTRVFSGVGARTLPFLWDACLNFPKPCVRPLPQLYSGPGTSQERRAHRVMWGHRCTLRRCFEDVKLPLEAWRCWKHAGAQGYCLHPWFACCNSGVKGL